MNAIELNAAADVILAETRRLSAALQAKGYENHTIEFWLGAGRNVTTYVNTPYQLNKHKDVPHFSSCATLADAVAQADRIIAGMVDQHSYDAWFIEPQAAE